jgi:UDP-N-acetylglucosamine transferase subunit ALG13
MIFVTVGAQMPFDRLIEAVDRWAEKFGRSDVIAQTGDGAYHPRHIQHVRQMEPTVFRATMVAADFIVAHAGMGSILTALEIGKPILVMPRRGNLMETRNDHQVATAQKLSTFGRVSVAMDEHELPEQLQQMGTIEAAEQIGPFASPSLLRALRNYIGKGKCDVRPQTPATELGLAAAELDLGRRVRLEAAPVLAHG